MKYVSLILLLVMQACYTNKTCEPLYIGDYKIDINYISHPACLAIVKQYRWDTVRLTSDEGGKYFFQTNDPRLKACEGEWWVSSANIDGDCIGHIRQKNHDGDVSKPPFYISIEIEGEAYTLPFRKVNSSGDFVNQGLP